MSNDIFDALDTFIAQFGQANGQKTTPAMATAKSRTPTMHQKPKISAAFHQFWPFWPLKTNTPRASRGGEEWILAITFFPLSALIGRLRNGQNGQNAPEVLILPDFLPYLFACHVEFERAKTTKPLERPTCACHLAHSERVPREVRASCRRRFRPGGEVFDLADDTSSIPQTTTPARFAGPGEPRACSVAGLRRRLRGELIPQEPYEPDPATLRTKAR